MFKFELSVSLKDILLKNISNEANPLSFNFMKCKNLDTHLKTISFNKHYIKFYYR